MGQQKLTLVLTIDQAWEFVKLELEGLPDSKPIDSFPAQTNTEKLIAQLVAIAIQSDPRADLTPSQSRVVEEVLNPAEFKSQFGRYRGDKHLDLFSIKIIPKGLVIPKLFSSKFTNLPTHRDDVRPWVFLFDLNFPNKIRFHDDLMQSKPVRIEILRNGQVREAALSDLFEILSAFVGDDLHSPSNPPFAGLRMYPNAIEGDREFTSYVRNLSKQGAQVQQLQLLQYSCANFEASLRELLGTGINADVWIADPEYETDGFQQDRINDILQKRTVDWKRICDENDGTLRISLYNPQYAAPRIAWVPGEVLMIGMYLRDLSQGHSLINGHDSPATLITRSSDRFDDVEKFANKQFQMLRNTEYQEFELPKAACKRAVEERI
tara:strand:- start:2904 stop:4040 length:1137 start_codon:yes stop_codon:yes gene_type:complete